MIGAIIGDLIGSFYEGQKAESKDFPLYNEVSRITDDSVLTTAVADAILNGSGYEEKLRSYGNKYPRAGFGGGFRRWLSNEKSGPYNSWGNGSAMRVSPVGWAYNSVEDVLREAEKTAAPTHNHPEGIKGAQAAALAVFLARSGSSKDEIRQQISATFNYDLSRTIKEIIPDYRFEISCQKSVPEAIIAFLDSNDFEDSLRNAIILGGDADTQAAIACSIAEAFYEEIPEKILKYVFPRIPMDILQICQSFSDKYLGKEKSRLVSNEIAMRDAGQIDGLYKYPDRYTILLSSKTGKGLYNYAEDIHSGRIQIGNKLQKIFQKEPVAKFSQSWLLKSLIETKEPCLFAESGINGDGSDWNATELSLLGNVSIAVPVRVYDDGHHTNPKIHIKPFNATLIYTPGALLRSGNMRDPADWSVVENGEINLDAYFNLYEQRLLPVLKYASSSALSRGKKALLTIPGLGCGQFAGPFHDQLGIHLQNAIKRILERHVQNLPGIKAIWFDPYSECEIDRVEIGDISYMIRPLTKTINQKSQLNPPPFYEEKDDDFSDCELFSVVAWDHVSWPGNDFYRGARMTDDGVKAAATDSMFALTGIRGEYDKNSHSYQPPKGGKSWEHLVIDNSIEIQALTNVLYIKSDLVEEELEVINE